MRRKNERKIRFPKQRAEELAKDHFFQEEIKKLRIKWGIPEGGIKSNEESEKWHRELSIKSDTYLDSKEFAGAKEALREKRKNNDYAIYSYNDYKDDLAKLNLGIPINEYRNDLLTLRRALKLSDYWDGFVERYLKFNDIYSLWGNNTTIVTNYNKNGDQELYIRIWEHTTLDDIKSIWSQIKIHQENIPGFKGVFRDSKLQILERNRYILELSRLGRKPKEITNLIAKHFVEKLEEDPDTYIISEENVRKIISESRKREPK